MFLCLCISVMLCVGHVTSNRLLVILSMALFMIGIAFTSILGKALYLVCFFLPWAPLIKFEPRTMSLYTVGLIAVCLLTWVRYKFVIHKYILPAMALVMFLFIVRMFYGARIDNSFIMFSIMLLLFPVMGNDLHKTYSFTSLNLFLSIGVISSALSAYYLVIYPSIAKFIDVYSWSEITRYSGYYGDSNFYSAHISAALAGLLIQFSGSGKKSWKFILLAVVLLYCGLLSASKSFVITIFVMFLLWIMHLLSARTNWSNKVITILAVIVVIGGILVSNAFADVLNVVAIRFGSASNISNFTTGRSDIWVNYIRHMVSNFEILLFGQGYTNILVEGRAAHNTLIQAVYQFGLVGLPLFFSWLKGVFEISLTSLKKESKNNLLYLILLLGVFLSWMSLDLLFFDEFFLMLLYVSLGFRWINEKSSEALS